MATGTNHIEIDTEGIITFRTDIFDIGTVNENTGTFIDIFGTGTDDTDTGCDGTEGAAIALILMTLEQSYHIFTNGFY